MSSTSTSNERIDQVEPNQDPGTNPAAEPSPDEDEFKITVKKLDMSVRPRGVLAE